MTTTLPILSFGSLNIDHVYSLSHIVRPGETLAANAYHIHPGGKGLNQALAMARAGLAVSHAGRIGKDGEWLKDVLCDSDVDCQHVQCCPEEHTGHAMIQVSQQDSQNSIVLHGGANQGWTEPAICNLFQQNWLAVVCQNEMNGLATLLQCADAKNIPVILNAAPYNSALDKLDLHKLHTLLVNETEAMELAGNDKIDSAFAELKKRYTQVRLVMTLGADGLRASHLGQDYNLSAFPTKMVDTTAAGDTFAGYYIASMWLHRPDDFQAALSLGSRAAALAVSRPGAAPSIPHIKEVKEH